MKYYFESLFNDNLAFILGWEAYVLFMLLFFVSIAYRLNRIESNLEELKEFTMEIFDEYAR
jgi:hypothetical protein|tara:strand:- start:363 stop:545 length:183 start_codon:yes stop_codon:yes gene_type:complete